MLEKFKNFLSEKSLIPLRNKIILAVSGGIDSVVMCELFYLANYKFEIAHCNFNLRGKESDKDETFVQKLAERFNVKFHLKKFETEKYARSNKISIQMAARELRFEWFNQLTQKDDNIIAIGSHLNDEVETVLINFIRGTGISGLHGISPKLRKVIRPLLFATRKEINAFANEKKLIWREDRSNRSEKYVRNKIRHSVIPILKEINPRLEQTISENIGRIREIEDIYHQQIESRKKEILISKNNDNRIYIPIKKLVGLFPLKAYLFEFLKPFGFNEAIVKTIILSMKEQSGKKFISDTHRLFKDREFLIIEKHNKDFISKGSGELFIRKSTRQITHPVKIRFWISDKRKFQIIKDEKAACLDYEKLQFPLLIRPWEEGDSFIPLGIKGRKKISDFMIDKKFPMPDKSKIQVLVSMGKIVWLVGHRIDERYKITRSTKKIFVAKPW